MPLCSCVLLMHPLTMFCTCSFYWSLVNSLLRHRNCSKFPHFSRSFPNSCLFALRVRSGLFFHRWEKLRLRSVTSPKVTGLLNGQTGMEFEAMGLVSPGSARHHAMLNALVSPTSLTLMPLSFPFLEGCVLFQAYFPGPLYATLLRSHCLALCSYNFLSCLFVPFVFVV